MSGTYLPLTAGSGAALTGDLYLNPGSPTAITETGDVTIGYKGSATAANRVQHKWDAANDYSAGGGNYEFCWANQGNCYVKLAPIGGTQTQFAFYQPNNGTTLLGTLNGTTTGINVSNVSAFYPGSDVNITNGTSSLRWSQTWSRQFDGVSQNPAFSATPNYNCTLGETISTQATTGNITGATMTSGNVGQVCTVAFLKDGTANQYTIVFSGTNVRTAGTLTMGAGASEVSTMTFRWDDQLATPAWLEISRTNGL